MPDSPADRELRFGYRLDLEYDGTHFHGWQVQTHERTVQGCLQTSINELFACEPVLHAAGRTDAGVHAAGQVVHFRTVTHRQPDVVQRALNAALPPDIRLLNVQVVPLDFHARYSAQWRSYRYRIALQPMAIGRYYSWHYGYRLDVQRMDEAARLIVGEHCFRSFAHEQAKERHYLSSVYRARWQLTDPYLEFQIEANRFLHGMVRILVGTFVRVGRAKIDAADVLDILAAQDVRRAGPKAPPHGLCLVAVGYAPWPNGSEVNK